MKKLTISLFILLLCAPIWGQKYSTIDFLCVEATINFDIDYSSAYILGAPAEDFIALESDWEEAEKKIKQVFISAFNEASLKGNTPILIKPNSDNNYTLVLILMEVTERGSHIEGFYEIVNKEGVCVFSDSFDREAGMFGSTINLMEDAFKDLGKDLGKEIGNNTFRNSTKVIEKQLSSATFQAIDIAVTVKMSESVEREYRKVIGKRRVELSDLDEMTECFVKSFNDNITKQGRYYQPMKATSESSSWKLTIVVQKAESIMSSVKASCTIQLIDKDGKEFYAQYNELSGKGDNPFMGVMTSLAKKMSNLKL